MDYDDFDFLLMGDDLWTGPEDNQFFPPETGGVGDAPTRVTDFDPFSDFGSITVTNAIEGVTKVLSVAHNNGIDGDPVAIKQIATTAGAQLSVGNLLLS